LCKKSLNDVLLHKFLKIRQKITAVAGKFIGKCSPTSGKSRRCHTRADNSEFLQEALHAIIF
jgi:hypothetical protein